MAGQGHSNKRNRKLAKKFGRREAIFRNRAREFKREASIELLQRLRTFTTSNRSLSAGTASNAVSALISSIIDNGSKASQQQRIDSVVRKFESIYGLQLRVLSRAQARRPFQPLPAYNWNVDGGEQLWEVLRPTEN